MKKLVTVMMTAMMCLLTACGGTQNAENTDVKEVNLGEFYTELETEYEWNGYLVDIEGEMLEGYYPGLSEIPAEQFVAKMPMMSSVVNELVFMECETEEGATQAATILQERIDTQAEGGAWYPESMEAWSRGEVIQNGTYVGMIASASYQDELVERFQQEIQ